MSELIIKDKPETNLYEAGYLVSPLVPEESIIATIDEFIRAAIEKASGVVTSQTQPKRRTLAYQIGKSTNHKRNSFREAYFGAIRFETLAERVAEIRKNLDSSELVLRYLIVNIPRRVEIPLPSRRLPIRRIKAADKPAGEKTEISKAELDKEIEELLAPAA